MARDRTPSGFKRAEFSAWFWIASVGLWILGAFLFGVTEHGVLSVIRPLALGDDLPTDLGTAIMVLGRYLTGALVLGMALQIVLTLGGGLLAFALKRGRPLWMQWGPAFHLILLAALIPFVYFQAWFRIEVLGTFVTHGFFGVEWIEWAGYLWGVLCIFLAVAVMTPFIRKGAILKGALTVFPALTFLCVAGFHLNTKALPGIFEQKSMVVNSSLVAGFFLMVWVLIRIRRFARLRLRLGSAGGGAAVVVLVTLAAVIAGPITTQLQAKTRPATSPGKRPNIVLIIMDEARADRITGYGGSPVITPWLDRIRKEGLMFERAYATSGWTIPSHASFFTGRFSFAHGVYGHNTWYLNPRLRTLAGFLRDTGYLTVGISANPIIGQWTGFSRGFKTFYEGWLSVSVGAYYPAYVALGKWTQRLRAYGGIGGEQGLRREKLARRVKTTQKKASSRPFVPPADKPVGERSSGPPFEVIEREMWPEPNMRVVKNAVEVVRTSVFHQDPFFLFINFFAPHEPYFAPRVFYERALQSGRYPSSPSWEREVRRALEDPSIERRSVLEINARQHGRFDLLNFLFDVKQAYADWLVGQVYQTLRETNVLNRTFLIVTSDHGQMLGEQGLFGHGEPLYEPVIRVPMFMRDPSRFSKGTTFAGLVSLVDLFPTILERAGVKTGDSKDMHGKSLFRMVKDGKGRSFVLAEAYGEKNVRSYISSNLKLMVEEGKGLILYDLVQDSRETENLSSIRPQDVLTLRKQLENLLGGPGQSKVVVEKDRPDVAIDRETEERLRAFGYIN